MSKSEGWVTDKSWKHSMAMGNNHILLLNPSDDKPRIYDNGVIMVKY